LLLVVGELTIGREGSSGMSTCDQTLSLSNVYGDVGRKCAAA
jgi:hypothetical protein